MQKPRIAKYHTQVYVFDTFMEAANLLGQVRETLNLCCDYKSWLGPSRRERARESEPSKAQGTRLDSILESRAPDITLIDENISIRNP